MQNELKPCPFCGGKAVIKHTCRISPTGWSKSYLIYWVECTKCGNKAKAYNDIDSTDALKEAIDTWNSRVLSLPCKLGDTAYCINGYEHKYIEKFTVEKIVISNEGLVLIDISGCEWLAKVCYFSLESAEKALKEPVPKASAHNSFFYNRFMKTV